MMPAFNSVPFYRRKLVFLSLFLSFSCSMPRKNETRVFDHRDPASSKNAQKNAAEPCALDPVSGSFSEVIATLQEYQLLTPTEALSLSSEEPTALAERLTSSLPGFYFENETLLRDFDRQIKSGKTLDELSRPKGGYAKILSARVLWDELNHALQAYARDRMMIAKQAAIESRTDHPAALLIKESKGIEIFFRNAASVATDDPALVSLSLETVRSYLKDATRFLLSCDSDADGWVDAEDAPHSRSVLIHAQNFTKKPLNRAILKNKNLPFGSSASQNAYRWSEGLMQEVLRERDAPPTDDPAVVYKPDVGLPGNIKGNLFPKGVWSVTYDDGPGAKTTPAILDHLDALNAKATFFVLTQQALRLPEIILRELKAGHSIASHSYSHAKFTDLGESGLKKELDDAIATLDEKTGTKVRFFRLPYGAGVSVSKIRERIAQLGLIHVFWNVDTLDWQDKNPDTIYARALTQMKTLGRGVILFHDIHPQSVIASERVFRYILNPENKLRHVTIPEIVDEQNKAASPSASPIPAPTPSI